MLADPTAPLNATAPLFLPPLVASLNPLKALVRLLTHPKLHDYLGLLILGIFAEFTRRSVIFIIPWLEQLISIKAIHTTLDPSHDYILMWWQSHPDWLKKTKHFNAETSFLSANSRIFPCKCTY